MKQYLLKVILPNQTEAQILSLTAEDILDLIIQEDAQYQLFDSQGELVFEFGYPVNVEDVVAHLEFQPKTTAHFQQNLNNTATAIEQTLDINDIRAEEIFQVKQGKVAQPQSEQPQPQPSIPEPPQPEPQPEPEQPAPKPEQPQPQPEPEKPAPKPEQPQPQPEPEQPAPKPEQPQPQPEPEQPTPKPEQPQPQPEPEQPTPKPEQPQPQPEPEKPAPKPEEPENPPVPEQPETPPATPPKVSLTVNDITDDNTLNKQESTQAVSLSGKITLENVEASALSLKVRLNNQEFDGTISGDTWSAEIPDNIAAALPQGQNQLTVSVMKGNETLASENKAFSVDTVLDKPQIIINAITEDNIINQAEASSGKAIVVSGKVINTANSNAKVGDLVTLSVGNASQEVRLVLDENSGELRFSAEIDPRALIAHQTLSVQVQTSDAAQNQATGEATHAYEVLTETSKPVLTLNDIAGDNVVNFAESKGMVAISGTVQNGVNGQKVVLTCGCPSCSGVNWQDVEATINDGNFSVNVQGADLVAAAKDGKMIIKADYTKTDKVGNQEVAESATKEYSVDLSKPDILVLMDAVSTDGIINITEATAENITITGSYFVKKSSVFPLGNDRGIVTYLQIGSSKIPVNFTPQNKFAVSVSTELLKNNLVDGSGVIHFVSRFIDHDDWLHDGYPINSATDTTSVQPLRYTFDTEAPELGVTIDPIPVINLEKAKQPITLTGTFTADLTKVQAESLAVEITLNGKKYQQQVRLDLAEKRWSLTLPAGELTFQQGEQVPISAKITGTSHSGNAGENTASSTYHVDTIAPQVELTLTVGDENKVSTTATGNITLKGTVQGEFNDSDKVILTVNGTPYEANLTREAETQNGNFTVEVPASELQTGTPVVQVAFQTQDTAGNLTELSVEQPYSLTTGEVSIQLNPITPDNHINVTEPKAGKITVTGSIDGEGLGSSPTVTLKLGEETLNVTLTDRTFTAEVPVDKLKASPNYQLTATVNGTEGNTATTTAKYSLSPELLASVDITAIGENFVVGAESTVRVKGTVDFSELYGKDKNALFLRSITVTIGEKQYQTGFDGKTRSFFLDIPERDIAELQGKAISVSFDDSRNKFPRTAVSLVEKPSNQPAEMPEVLKKYDYDTKIHDNPEVQVSRVNFTGPVTTSSDNQYTFNAPIPTVTLQGTLTNAKEGDSVVVTIGEYRHEIQITADNQREFSLTVNKAEFAGNRQVNAVLKTHNALGEKISVVDSEAFAAPIKAQGDFVNPHEKVIDTTALPYFIKGVDAGTDRAGFLSRFKYGGDGSPIVLKYHFVNAETARTNASVRGSGTKLDTNSYQEFNDEYKAAIREAFKEFSTYTNVQFEESTDFINSNEGVRLYLATFKDDHSSYAAAGAYGGDVHWNTVSIRQAVDNETAQDKTNRISAIKRVAMHEISHTLQMQHIEHGNNYSLVRPGFGDNYKNDSDPNYHNYAKEASSEFTLMSYRVNKEAEGTQSLRPYDLAFLHYRFGVNKNHRSGDDTYTFKDYDFNAADGAKYIWDGGGVDVFDASAEEQGVHVNLTPGSWIYSGNQKGSHLLVSNREYYTPSGGKWGRIENTTKFFDILDGNKHRFDDVSGSSKGLDRDFVKAEDKENRGPRPISFMNYNKGQAFIGYGTQLENLIGSKFDDTLIGNNADNNISGGAGDDIIKGGAGNDYLDGGAGNDQLYGGEGDDKYVVDNASDTVIEEASQGIDTVYSTVDYTLTDNVENLVLLGTTATQATGNSLANTLTANNQGNTLNGGAGDDRLIGGLGADTLTGGDGADTFVFNTQLNGNIDTITDFVSGTDKIELSRQIFDSLLENMTNLADFIKYDANSGNLSYDPDGRGTSDPIIFANLQKAAFDVNVDILIV